MNYKETFIFLLKILSSNNKNEIILWLNNKGIINTELLVWIASNHLIFPSVFKHIKRLNIENLFPDEFLNYAEYIYNQNKKRNIKIIKQAKEINALLRKNSIRLVFLKGVATLVNNLYIGEGERMIGDIDFLVKEHDFKKAVKLLQNHGYQNNYPHPTSLKNIKHYPRLIRNDRLAAVEIHRQPVKKAYEKYLNNEMVFKNAKTAITDKNISIPSENDMAIHCFVHSHLNNKSNYYGSIDLRNAFEFYLLQKNLFQKTDFNEWNFRKIKSFRDAVYKLFSENYAKSTYSNLYLIRFYLNLKHCNWRVFNSLILLFIQKSTLCFNFIIKFVTTSQARFRLLNNIKNKNWLVTHYFLIKEEIKSIYLIKNTLKLNSYAKKNNNKELFNSYHYYFYYRC